MTDYVLVPREATAEMRVEGGSELRHMMRRYNVSIGADEAAACYREMIAAAPSPWRSMDSAPRDGTEVIVGRFDYAGVWRQHKAVWCIPYEDAPAEQGWWRYDGRAHWLDGFIHGPDVCGVTHWHPLPAPPIEEKKP